MYTLRAAKSFPVSYNTLVKGNQQLEKRLRKALRLLHINPQYPSLKSHKVNTRNFGETWSSWITGDLRIIWDFDQENHLIILLLAVSKHSGTHREYK